MKPYVVALIIIGIVLLLTTIVLFVSQWVSKKKMKWLINHSLYHLVKDEDFYLLNGLILNLAEDTTIHVDHLVCGDKFIYLISDRYLNDGIEGSPQDKTIFTYKRKKRIEVQNPINFNEARSLKLAKYLNWTEDKQPIVISIVVLNNGIKISDNLKLNGPTSFVVERKNLNKLIKRIESESPAGTFDPYNLEKMVEHLNHLSLQSQNILAGGGGLH